MVESRGIDGNLWRIRYLAQAHRAEGAATVLYGSTISEHALFFLPGWQMQRAVPLLCVMQVERLLHGLLWMAHGLNDCSHRSPVTNGGQMHSNIPGMAGSKQVAPFWQGLQSHSSTSSVQTDPCQPGLHVQLQKH